MPNSSDETGGAPVEITSEQMTEWNAIIKVNKIHKADQVRVSQLAFATNVKTRIQKLPQENLTASHLRRFHLIKSEADEILSKANHLNKAFISILLDQNPEVLKNPVYLNDQEKFYEALSTL